MCHFVEKMKKNLSYTLNQRIIKETVLYIAEARLLHSGGSYCMVRARSA